MSPLGSNAFLEGSLFGLASPTRILKSDPEELPLRVLTFEVIGSPQSVWGDLVLDSSLKPGSVHPLSCGEQEKERNM